MSRSAQPRRATIIGAGPVGCLLAIGLRVRSFEVDVYESTTDPRVSPRRGHSFNLTLTLRGLSSLEPWLRDIAYAQGIALPQRVVHHVDGPPSYQRYGTRPEHHLLSVHRALLHESFLDEAEKAGARIHFEHQCVGVDPRQGRVSLTVRGESIHHTSADLVIGCDGANSIVRRDMARHGARMHINQEYVEHGFVELKMPPAPDNGFALLGALRDNAVPASRDHGLHIWPRGAYWLLSQPNLDRSYTTSLFLPLFARDGEPDVPSFETVCTASDVTALFDRRFPGVGRLLPRLTSDFFDSPPASLRIVKCSPYHHGRAVLLGDSAHTLVPFYGQGINCSFEDVKVFLEILDRAWVVGGSDSIPAALAEFTDVRLPSGHAITQLSLDHLEELSSAVGQEDFLTRTRLERELHRRHPDEFTPLYDMVAFSNIPYHEVMTRHERQRALLDDLCRRHDPARDIDRIIAEYRAAQRATPVPAASPPGDGGLALSAAATQRLLTTVVSRVVEYQADLERGRYPASYLHDSVNVERYRDGIRASERLREPDVPRDSTDLDALLEEIFGDAMTNGTVHPHPGFLAHVPSGGLLQSAVGDFLAHILNRFVGVWGASPGFSQIEANVIRWYCTILGYGDSAFGYLTTGGSIANFMAMRCALERLDPRARSAATVYVSEQGHFSVAKAARLAGIPADQVRHVATLADHTMDVAALLDAVEADRRCGLVPACVVATAGTTNTGAVDDLERLAGVCRAERIWLHVDACLGGFFQLTGRGRRLLCGIEAGDSIAVDAHKSLFLPHGHSALLVRDREDLRAAFDVPGAPYMAGFTDRPDLVDMCNYGPELSREVRGLAAWLPIKLHGIDAFRRCLDDKLDLGDQLAERLAGIDRVEVVPRGVPHLPVVGFKLRAADRAAEDELNLRLCERISSRGNVYVATTRLPRHGVVLRACVLHHRTDLAVVERLIEDLTWSVRNLG